MSDLARPRRSALYMPASNAKAVEKARTLDADVIILDLEDAVAPDMKDAARDAAVAAVKAGGFGPREIVIRTNGLDTPWGEADLKAAVEAGPDAVLVPKVNDAADVYAYQAALHAAPVHTKLWTMIETCKAAFHLWEIAAASRTTRLTGWVMGVNDLAKEMRARQTPGREAFLPILSLSVAAARAHGLTILDGVHNDIEDLDGAPSRLRPGRRLRLRRQDPDPPQALGNLQPRLLAHRRRDRLEPGGDRRLRRAGERRQGRPAGRGQDGRAAAPGSGRAAGGGGRRHRRTLGRLETTKTRCARSRSFC
jgi:citrate lyase beta subunit